MAEIVNIDLETGDLSEFSSAVADGGDLSAAGGAAALHGNYGLSVLVDDANGIYGSKSGLNNTSGKIRARFYININTLTMGSTEQFIIIICLNSGGSAVGRIDTYYASGVRVIATINNDAGGTSNSAAYLLSSGLHYIEFYIQRAASNVSSDGSMQLWIDGVSKQTLSGIDNYDRFNNFNTVNFGAVGAIDANTSGTFYLDDLVINDDGAEIGAYASAGVAIPVFMNQYRQRRN